MTPVSPVSQMVGLSSMQVIGASLTVDGKLDFLNNNAANFDGGALYVTSYGQVVLEHGTEMNFIGNSGRIGSAIVVESQNIVRVSETSVPFNPQCFLQYGPEPNLSPLKWEEVGVRISQFLSVRDVNCLEVTQVVKPWHTCMEFRVIVHEGFCCC